MEYPKNNIGNVGSAGNPQEMITIKDAYFAGKLKEIQDGLLVSKTITLQDAIDKYQELFEEANKSDKPEANLMRNICSLQILQLGKLAYSKPKN